MSVATATETEVATEMPTDPVFAGAAWPPTTIFPAVDERVPYLPS